MPRYLRTLRAFWATSLGAELEYRTNFVLGALTAAGGLGGAVFGLWLFYRAGYQPGGWPWHEALLVVAFFTLLQGLSATLLSPNLSQIVEHVQQGTLDFVLLKPIDSQFWVSARMVSPWGLPDVVFGLGVAFYAGSRLDFGPLAYLYGLLPVVLAFGTLYALWFVLAATAIWFVKVYNATEVLRGLLDAGRFPVGAFPRGMKAFFTFVVPVAFLTTVPAELMLGRAGGGWLAGAAALAVGLFLVTRWFWRFALRYYTSASS
jgi:ABC-2 type transport system permease protein